MAELPKIKNGSLKNRAVKVLEIIAESSSLEGLNPSINKVEAIKASAAEVLIALDSGNPKSLGRLISLLEQDKDNDLLIKKLNRMLPSNYFEIVISELKQFIDTQTYETKRNLYNNCFKTLWYCAQNMSYPDFYQAWHGSTTTDAELPTE